MARDSVSIPVEPTIAPPKHPVKTRQAEYTVERPCPPDSPRHIKVCVGTRFQFSASGQHSYIVQQILWREFQAALGRSGLQVFKCKATSAHYLFPKVNPAMTESASAVV